MTTTLANIAKGLSIGLEKPGDPAIFFYTNGDAIASLKTLGYSVSIQHDWCNFSQRATTVLIYPSKESASHSGSFGIAKQNPKDQWVRKYGTRLALYRAIMVIAESQVFQAPAKEEPKEEPKTEEEYFRPFWGYKIHRGGWYSDARVPSDTIFTQEYVDSHPEELCEECFAKEA